MWRLAVPGSETPRSSPHSITRIKNYRNRCIDTPCPTSSPRVRQPWSWSMLAPRSPRGIKLHPPTVVTVHQYPSFLISLPQSLNRSPPKSAAFPEIFVSGSASGGPSHTHTHTPMYLSPSICPWSRRTGTGARGCGHQRPCLCVCFCVLCTHVYAAVHDGVYWGSCPLSGVDAWSPPTPVDWGLHIPDEGVIKGGDIDPA